MMFMMSLTRWWRWCCRRSRRTNSWSTGSCWERLWSIIRFCLLHLRMRKRPVNIVQYVNRRKLEFTIVSFDNSCCSRICNDRTSSSGNCIKSLSLGSKRILCISNWRICSIWWNASSRCCITRFFSCSSCMASRRLSSASRRQCSEDYFRRKTIIKKQHHGGLSNLFFRHC